MGDANITSTRFLNNLEKKSAPPIALVIAPRDPAQLLTSNKNKPRIIYFII